MLFFGCSWRSGSVKADSGSASEANCRSEPLYAHPVEETKVDTHPSLTPAESPRAEKLYTLGSLTCPFAAIAVDSSAAKLKTASTMRIRTCFADTPMVQG
jgi:hypothetical protein